MLDYPSLQDMGLRQIFRVVFEDDMSECQPLVEAGDDGMILKAKFPNSLKSKVFVVTTDLPTAKKQTNIKVFLVTIDSPGFPFSSW